MTSRAEAILREMVDDPVLAWRVLDGASRVVHVTGPWLPEGDPPRRWERRYPGGGTATWTTYPATEAMLRDADSRLLATRPMLSLVGRRPCDAPGIVPECGEVHPMTRAMPRLAGPGDERRSLACELPAGHYMACGAHDGGYQWTASNAMSRREDRLQSAGRRAEGEGGETP